MILTGSFHLLLTSKWCKYVLAVLYTCLPNYGWINELLLKGAAPFSESTQMRDEDGDDNYGNKQSQIKYTLKFEREPNGKTSAICSKLWKCPFNGN